MAPGQWESADKPQAQLMLCERAFDAALCHVQIQPAGPGHAGKYPAAGHSE